MASTAYGEQLNRALFEGNIDAVCALAPKASDYQEHNVDSLLCAMALVGDILRSDRRDWLCEALSCLVYIHSCFQDNKWGREYVDLVVDLKVKIILNGVLVELSDMQDRIHEYFDPSLLDHVEEVSEKIEYKDEESYSAVMHKSAYNAICKILVSDESLTQFRDKYGSKLHELENQMVKRLNKYLDLVREHMKESRNSQDEYGEDIPEVSRDSPPAVKIRPFSILLNKVSPPTLRKHNLRIWKSKMSLRRSNRQKKWKYADSYKQAELEEKAWVSSPELISCRASQSLRDNSYGQRAVVVEEDQSERAAVEDDQSSEGEDGFQMYLPSRLLEFTASQQVGQNSQDIVASDSVDGNGSKPAPRFFYEDSQQDGTQQESGSQLSAVPDERETTTTVQETVLETESTEQSSPQAGTSRKRVRFDGSLELIKKRRLISELRSLNNKVTERSPEFLKGRNILKDLCAPVSSQGSSQPNNLPGFVNNRNILEDLCSPLVGHWSGNDSDTAAEENDLQILSAMSSEETHQVLDSGTTTVEETELHCAGGMSNEQTHQEMDTNTTTEETDSQPVGNNAEDSFVDVESTGDGLPLVSQDGSLGVAVPSTGEKIEHEVSAVKSLLGKVHQMAASKIPQPQATHRTHDEPKTTDRSPNWVPQATSNSTKVASVTPEPSNRPPDVPHASNKSSVAVHAGETSHKPSKISPKSSQLNTTATEEEHLLSTQIVDVGGSSQLIQCTPVEVVCDGSKVLQTDGSSDEQSTVLKSLKQDAAKPKCRWGRNTTKPTLQNDSLVPESPVHKDQYSSLSNVLQDIVSSYKQPSPKKGRGRGRPPTDSNEGTSVVSATKQPSPRKRKNKTSIDGINKDNVITERLRSNQVQTLSPIAEEESVDPPPRKKTRKEQESSEVTGESGIRRSRRSKTQNSASAGEEVSEVRSVGSIGERVNMRQTRNSKAKAVSAMKTIPRRHGTNLERTRQTARKTTSLRTESDSNQDNSIRLLVQAAMRHLGEGLTDRSPEQHNINNNNSTDESTSQLFFSPELPLCHLQSQFTLNSDHEATDSQEVYGPLQHFVHKNMSSASEVSDTTAELSDLEHGHVLVNFMAR